MKVKSFIVILVFILINISYSQDFFIENKTFNFNRNSSLAKPGDVFADSCHSFDVTKYYLKLDVPMTVRYYSGSVKISFKSVQDMLYEMVLHSEELEIDSVFNSFMQPLDYSVSPGYLTIDLNVPLALGDSTYVIVFYRYTREENKGYYFNEKNAFTKSEPWDARYWMPCFDEPWDKAAWECEITVPQEYKVASNGILIDEVNNTGGTKTWHWRENHLLTTYLMAFSISDFTVFTQTYVQNGIEIPIINYVFPEDYEKALYDLEDMPEMMELYSQIFDELYPYDKYGHMEVVGWGGGMEHTSITTANQSWFDGQKGYEGGFAHELIHQWFGDLVTCLDFRNIWLNEGYATYFTGEWYRHKYGDDNFIGYMIYMQDRVFQADNSFQYAIYDPPEQYIFGVNEYQKAAWVLHMLRNIVGENTFWNIIHAHLDRFKWGNIDTEDFIQLVGEFHGDRLQWFFDQWIFDIGIPNLEYYWTSERTSNGYRINLNIEQVQDVARTFRLPLEIGILTADYNYRLEQIEMNQRSGDYAFIVPEEPINLAIDPNYKVLKRHYMSPNVPEGYAILQPYPNPAELSETNEISIKYNLPVRTDVKFIIYNILGQIIREYSLFNLPPGVYVKSWDMKNRLNKKVSSGIYFVRLKTREFDKVKKFVILK